MIAGVNMFTETELALMLTGASLITLVLAWMLKDDKEFL